VLGWRELVLGLLEALTTGRLGRTMPTLVDMGNSGYDACELTISYFVLK